ncbi:hypothetical protein [Spongiactinospora sp. 9N601]|uniref:hypothetical protein n=1 Tax=Spongiactinospora sp. 9N601 TaxID=3375149 RepID=UPI0037AB82AE
MQPNRWAGRLVQRGLVSAGILLALLALSPQEWTKKLGEWTAFIFQWQTLILGAAIVVLATQLIIAKQPFLARLEYIMPSEYHGIPDMAPKGIQAKITGILELLGNSGDQAEHVVRIVVLTGRSTLHYLDQVIDKYTTRSAWEVRVLLVDPESPEIDNLQEGATEQIIASCAMLESMRRRIAAKARPVRIEWRGYRHLPSIRAFLIDNDHMFFGYFEWRKVGDSWKLHEQNKRFIYAKQGDELSKDSIDFFRNWFDHEWEIGRVLASPGGREVENTG